jgi:hypothetical protein
VGAAGGRPRKIATPEILWEKWTEYKALCDNRVVEVTDFSGRNSQHVTTPVKKNVTYTILGFCTKYVGITRDSFYEYYGKNPRFADTVARMRAECEVDAREKFELGVIPTQLAALWMSNYGYSTKLENNVTGAMPVVLVDDLGDKNNG